MARFDVCLQGRPVLVQSELAVAQRQKKLPLKLRLVRLARVAIALLGECGGVNEVAGAEFLVRLLVLCRELLFENKLWSWSLSLIHI